MGEVQRPRRHFCNDDSFCSYQNENRLDKSLKTIANFQFKSLPDILDRLRYN